MDSIGAREDVLRAAKLMYMRQMVNAYEGNVSRRIGQSLLITPSQVCKEELTPEDLVEVDIETGETVWAANGRRASSELKVHLCCYRSRSDIQGVVHAHPPYATAFALRRQPIETQGYPEMMLLFGKTPVCSYGTPSTQAVCDDIPEVLKRYDTFLLANHGLCTVGITAMAAAYKLESIESIAKVLTIARSSGGEYPLPTAEAEALERERLSKF